MARPESNSAMLSVKQVAERLAVSDDTVYAEDDFDKLDPDWTEPEP